MRRLLRTAVACVIACAGASCARPEEPKQAGQTDKGAAQMQKGAEQVHKSVDEVQKSASQMQKGAEDMAKGFADMAKGFTAIAGGDSDTKPVDPVSFRDLQNVLPDIGGGWQKGKPTGERMTSPVTYAQAAVTYRKGNAQIDEKIVDSGFSQLLLAPYSMFLTMGYEKESEDGYERALKIRGFPGWEKWNSTSRNGELNALVGKRFVVQIEGRDIDDPKALHDAMDQTDLRKLAAMK